MVDDIEGKRSCQGDLSVRSELSEWGWMKSSRLSATLLTSDDRRFSSLTRAIEGNSVESSVINRDRHVKVYRSGTPIRTRSAVGTTQASADQPIRGICST